MKKTVLGASYSEILKTILSKPLFAIKTLLGFSQIGFLVLIFAPMGFGLLALRAPSILALLLFDLGIILMWELNPLSQIVYHHAAPLVPIIVVATIYGIANVRRFSHRFKINKARLQVALVSFILVTSILANVFYGPFTILYGKRAFF